MPLLLENSSDLAKETYSFTLLNVNQSIASRCAITLAVDDRFAYGAAATISSLGCNGGLAGAVPVFVVRCGLTAGSEKALRRVAEKVGIKLFFLDARPVPEYYPTGKRFSGAAYVRLQLASLLENIDRILYLDSDTLILGQLNELLETDLAGFPVAAVPEFFQGRLTERPSGPKRRTRFNTGVMLIDTARWQTQSVSERVDQFVRTRPEACQFAEQEALNETILEWHMLSERWNFYPLAEHFSAGVLSEFRIPEADVAALDRARPNARILHFVGPVKPWDAGFPDGPNADLFRDHLLHNHQ